MEKHNWGKRVKQREGVGQILNTLKTPMCNWLQQLQMLYSTRYVRGDI